MLVRDEVIAKVEAALRGRVDVLESYLFGSVARGDAQPHSDVDVAVRLDDVALASSSFGVDVDIATLLMSALGTNRVDVVVLNHADPVLYHRVLRDGVRLTSRDLVATTRREGQALSRYCDFVPQLAKIHAAQDRRMAAGQFGR